MSHLYFKQSTDAPKFNQYPNPTEGYMIKVESKKCPYGTKCYRKCWSIPSYPQGGDCNGNGNHQTNHWHIAPDSKWTDGRHTIPFRK